MEERRNILIKVPPELHRRFKTLCAENDVTMQKVIEGFITGSVTYGEIKEHMKTKKVSERKK